MKACPSAMVCPLFLRPIPQVVGPSLSQGLSLSHGLLEEGWYSCNAQWSLRLVPSLFLQAFPVASLKDGGGHHTHIFEVYPEVPT